MCVNFVYLELNFNAAVTYLNQRNGNFYKKIKIKEYARKIKQVLHSTYCWVLHSKYFFHVKLINQDQIEIS